MNFDIWNSCELQGLCNPFVSSVLFDLRKQPKLCDSKYSLQYKFVSVLSQMLFSYWLRYLLSILL